LPDPVSNTIAVIFDYDDTIVPDSLTQLLAYHSIDTKKFWKQEWPKLIRQQYDPTHAYLRLILDKIGTGRPLGQLTNNELFEFGSQVEKTQYPGLEPLIKDLKKRVAKRQINIEFYIISSGLEEIVRGNNFIRENFSAIYGCRLAGETATSGLKYIKRAITFTEKTRFLFEINKGIPQNVSDRSAMEVNKKIEKKERKIPFDNMIYIGDGLTDIPCFSVVKNEQNKGVPIGIKHRHGRKSEKIKSYLEILKSGRVEGMYYPEYNRGSDLGDFIKLAVDTICGNLVIQKKLIH